VKIQTLPLRQALKLVSSIVPKNTIVPIYEGVKFESGFLTASNGEVSMRVPMVATFPDCVLQYATLSAAVNALTDDEITFDLTDTAATIRSGRTRINVPVLGQLEDFPRMGTDVNAPSCTLSRENIERVAAMAAFASTDNLRPAMTGVYFDGKDFVTTNGFTLANYHINGESFAPCALPMRLFILLNSFAKATEYKFENGSVQVLRDADVLAEVNFRCIDERYPDWKLVVPMLNNHAVAEFEREEMSDALEVLNIALSKENPNARFEFSVGGGVTATASDITLNKDAATAVAADIAKLSKSVAMGFNTGFLANALKYVGGEMVRGYFNEPSRAAIFKNPEFSGYALVMPTAV
jgi:DNA polymerase III sliding clamp (beta) subunit (PCNA family)